MSGLDEKVSGWIERLLGNRELADKLTAYIERYIYAPIVNPILRVPVIDMILRPDGRPGVAGVYGTESECVLAIEKLYGAGFKRLVVHSPVPSHAIEEATDKGPSIIRFFTLTGGVLGGTLGFLLASLTSLKWNLVVSGKPIVSVPPFLIITFECIILLGAIFTMAGFILSTRLPQLRLSEVYRESFGDDMFGVGIVCDENDLPKAEGALHDSGALEVYRAQE